MKSKEKIVASSQKLEARKIMEKIKKLPDKPGVYMFVGSSKRSEDGTRGKKILYIGKATSLRDRVKSYFNKDIVNTRSPLISKMLSEFNDIEFIETPSVLEALVLEANLIKKYQPEANIKEKDNRSFNYVVITDENFPRVLIMRGRELEKKFQKFSEPSSRENPRKERRRRTEEIFSKKFPWFSRDAAKENLDKNSNSNSFSISYIFGPFPNGSQLKEAMKIVRKMFPFRDKCIPAEEQKKRTLAPRSFSGVGCFNRQIGLCPGVCTGEISKQEYAKTIKNIILFFEGSKKKLLKNLEKQMKDFAKTRQFEKAQKIKKTIFTLNHIQDVALIKDNLEQKNLSNFRIESYDIAHLSGTNVVGTMTVIENGEVKKSDYRKFKIKNTLGINDVGALSEVLTRRLAHNEWPMPDLIVVDGGIAQKNIMEKVLDEHKLDIAVVSVVKDERHKAREILGLNNLAFAKAKINIEKEILLSNAEAHRFAIGFHKQLRRKI